jgi:hypothetical protein
MLFFRIYSQLLLYDTPFDPTKSALILKIDLYLVANFIDFFNGRDQNVVP